MAPMTARKLVLLSALVVAGCSTAGDGQHEPAATTTIMSVQPDCAAIADNARRLATELRQLAAGDSTVDEVRAATDELARTVDDAKATVGADARARFGAAEDALRQVRDSLDAQPVDWAGVHAGADDLVTALRDVADVCDATPT
jgi:PBP1b-binding outer membrane lipoprotein LpoB